MDKNKDILVIEEIEGPFESKSELAGDRMYRTVRFAEQLPAGVFSNAKVRTRNLWDKGPYDSPGDRLYKAIEDGRVGVGTKVVGKIETIKTNPLYIENPNGKAVHPETQNPANIARQFTGVVFEEETIEQRARNSGYSLPGDEGQTMEAQEGTVSEEEPRITAD